MEFGNIYLKTCAAHLLHSLNQHSPIEKGTGLHRSPQFILPEKFGLFSGLRHWKNRNKGTALEAFVEFDVAVDGCKNRVILAHADAHAWPHLRATLAHDDVTWNDDFATEFLYAKTTTS